MQLTKLQMRAIISWIKSNKLLSVFIVVLIVIIVVLIVRNKSNDFASCLKKSGAKFYGGSRCPKCQAQKKMFGSNAGNLPYIECETSMDECLNAGVKAYPTWIFQNGQRTDGKILTIEELKKYSGCA